MSLFLDIAMQWLVNYLRREQNPCLCITQQQLESEGIRSTQIFFFMIAVFIMCAASWIPLTTSKPFSGRRDSNQDEPPQPQPPAMN